MDGLTDGSKDPLITCFAASKKKLGSGKSAFIVMGGIATKISTGESPEVTFKN